HCLAEPRLANEKVRVGQPVGPDLRAQLVECLRVAGYGFERIGHGAWLVAARRAFVSRSRSRRWARPRSHTPRTRCREVMLVTIARRKTTTTRPYPPNSSPKTVTNTRSSHWNNPD